MQISSKWWKRLGIGLAVVVVAVVCVRTWVVPALIVGQLQSRFKGKVTIRDWWAGGRSAGVVGLTLHEGPSAGSPVFASADRVTTDLTIGDLLHGRFSPGLITLSAPEIMLRLDRENKFLNLPVEQGKGGGGGARLPDIAVEKARVTFRQEGRPEMVVSGVAGRLRSGPKSLELDARADDPAWGAWRADGPIAPDFASGQIALRGPRVEADPEKLARIPFVPAEVWMHVRPRGPVGVRFDLTWRKDAARPVGTHVEVTFLGTRGIYPSLGIETTGTTGLLVVDDGVVRLDKVEGRSIGGKVAARGTLDFTRPSPRFDLDLGLTKINVADAPRTWQLDEAGVTGLLTGKVQLRAVLGPRGVDLSGTTGDAVVEGGTIGGIPVKSLKLAMHAEGNDLQYSNPPSASLVRGVLGALVASISAPIVEELVALQATPPPAPEKVKAKAAGIQLPKSITTELELEDVDVKQLVAKAQFLTGFPFPIPITGKLTLKATATIPLGALREVKAYAFHGDLTLTGASINKVDFGRLAARIDLADGVLDLTDLRGRLVDHPDGGPDNPPPAQEPAVAPEGPLPTGGFRANVHAELSPPGRLSVKLDGHQLPLGELAAPALPRPTPLSGLASMNVEAHADLGKVRDPEAWEAAGRAESEHITYRGAAMDAVALRFTLKGGKVDLPELTAKLDGRPLAARGGLDLKPPQAFHGTLDVTGWDLAAILALVPSAPHPSPVAGTITAHADAKGTMSPFAITTEGRGQFGRFQAGPVPLGDVPFRWTTEGDTVVVSGVEAHPFGGTIQAEARVPAVAGKPTVGSASFREIDTAKITAAIPGQGLKLTGTAGGRVTFSLPPDVSALEANVQLTAPDLTIQGVPAEQVQASVRAHQGKLRYEVTADSLGGKIKFQGDFPLTSTGPPQAANGELRVVGFTLDQLWKALNIKSALAGLEGLGAIDANLRNLMSGADAGLWLRGIAEFRNLTWGPDLPLGQLRGVVTRSPAAWRVEPLTGELLGGPAGGVIWGTTPARGAPRMGFEFRIDRVALARVLASRPALARIIDGFATIRLTGGLDETFHAGADLQVPHGRVMGLALSELRAPAELSVTPGTGHGTLQVRHWSARLAGGHVRGDAWFHLGEDRAFHGSIQLADLDLQMLTRLESDVSRPASGKISGRINFNGPDPAQPARYRGKVVLDLDDASLVALPVFREVNKFLGAAQGGVFEDGDLVGTIANRHLIVEMLTLEGRVVQLHATGTVGFDGQLDLEVLINTSQTIPETGQALVGRIPGLRDVLGRSQEMILRIAIYLSSRLLKLRVGGTVKNPSVAVDPSIGVDDSAAGFFAGVLKLPLK